MNCYSPISGIFATGRTHNHPSFQVDNAYRTWGEFRRSVYFSQRYLSYRKQKRWLLNCDDLYDFAIGFFALLAAGKTVIIPPNFLAGTLRDLAGYYDSVWSADNFSHVLLDTEIKESANFTSKISRNREVQIFTSGTTGEPKKVVKKLAQFEDEIKVLENLFGDDCGSAHVLGSVPHQHIYGLLFRILWPLATGRTIVTRPCTSPPDLNSLNRSSAKNILVSSPAFLSRLHDLLDLSVYRDNLAVVFSSGGALHEVDAIAIKKSLGKAPVEVFGSTETGGVAWRRFGENEDPELWSTLPGVDVGNTDEGALTVNSPFTGGMKMIMGDGVEILPKGLFRLGPRLDRIVKVQEKRVSLAEVERTLRESPLVKDAAVVHQTGRRPSLGVVVILAESTDIGNRDNRLAIIGQLKSHLAVRFEPAAIPRQWRFLENLPYDERGKLAQDSLLNFFKNKPDVNGDQD